MILASFTETAMSDYASGTTGTIYSLGIDISDIEKRVQEMHKVITDTSWLEPLDIIDQSTYAARSKPTIVKVVEDILSNVESDRGYRGEYRRKWNYF